ncbi:MAG: serine--tRNA ligase [Lentisphaeria bacterium]|nr:serine--tRNA ligase [Lentisphaeria bacterium]
MIDIKILRTDPERVKANCARRGIDVDIDALFELDKSYLQLLQDVEGIRAQRNELAEECKNNPDAREQMKTLKQDLSAKECELGEVKVKVEESMAWLPNFLDDTVPDGHGDEDNFQIATWGEIPTFDFEARDHQALGEQLDIIDTKRGAKVAQSGFYYWKGQGAQLAAALFFWTQQELIKRGFTLFFSPCAAKQQTLFGTGYLPFFADQTYNLESEDLSLIGTSEQTLVAYHSDETLPAAELPHCYTAFTPCFRTEAGSYGKETRGIFRVHQFHKVEQIVFCMPDESPKYHQMCQDNEQALMELLGLPYRVVNVCVGDMGAPGYKKFDIEAWFPGYGGYREVTSNTNLTDFQSRRLGIRYNDGSGGKGFVHTISATAVTDRVVCAIMENFQDADGCVTVPEVLRPYTGFDRLTP